MAKTTPFQKAINTYKDGAVIMLELPAEAYFDMNAASVLALTKAGFDGVYISFQRPFPNIASMLKERGIPTDRLVFIDIASAFAKEKVGKGQRCVSISPTIDIDELVKAIYTSLPKLKSKKRFIFIDSLTTISFYKPLSEVLRLSEFLMRAVRNHEAHALILNVAKDLAQRRFIRDIALHADEVIAVAP